MHGAAYRFGNEIHTQRVILPIVNTYITPIIEFGSTIWRREIEAQNKKIEASQRFGTRLYLGLPYSTRDPRYKPYAERLKICKMISMSDRSNIAAIAFVCKSMQGKIKSTISDEIIRRRNTRTITRNPRLFNLEDLPIGGPLHRLLFLANQLRDNFSLEEEVQTTKNKLKKHYLDMLAV